MSENSILVVDDHSITRQLSIKILKQLGVESILEATNGQEALDLLSDQTVGLILLDLSMPVMDGAEMLKHLKADDRLENIPVVMITAAAEQNKVDEALELGADLCILKPVAKQALSDIIMKYL